MNKPAVDTKTPTPPEKLSGGLPDAPEDVHDEDALDEALAESFPASDPVAPGTAVPDPQKDGKPDPGDASAR